VGDQVTARSLAANNLADCTKSINGLGLLYTFSVKMNQNIFCRFKATEKAVIMAIYLEIRLSVKNLCSASLDRLFELKRLDLRDTYRPDFRTYHELS
jgi:hypothetical protein